MDPCSGLAEHVRQLNNAFHLYGRLTSRLFETQGHPVSREYSAVDTGHVSRALKLSKAQVIHRLFSSSICRQRNGTINQVRDVAIGGNTGVMLRLIVPSRSRNVPSG